jgi:hypothetical protein
VPLLETFTSGSYILAHGDSLTEGYTYETEQKIGFRKKCVWPFSMRLRTLSCWTGCKIINTGKFSR